MERILSGTLAQASKAVVGSRTVLAAPPPRESAAAFPRTVFLHRTPQGIANIPTTARIRTIPVLDELPDEV